MRDKVSITCQASKQADKAGPPLPLPPWSSPPLTPGFTRRRTATNGGPYSVQKSIGTRSILGLLYAYVLLPTSGNPGHGIQSTPSLSVPVVGRRWLGVGLDHPPPDLLMEHHRGQDKQKEWARLGKAGTRSKTKSVDGGKHHDERRLHFNRC